MLSIDAMSPLSTRAFKIRIFALTHWGIVTFSGRTFVFCDRMTIVEPFPENISFSSVSLGTILLFETKSLIYKGLPVPAFEACFSPSALKSPPRISLILNDPSDFASSSNNSFSFLSFWSEFRVGRKGPWLRFRGWLDERFYSFPQEAPLDDGYFQTADVIVETLSKRL